MALETAATTSSFEVYVSKDTFKFNAAHFVAFENYRERLHGHNYRVGVRLLGQRNIGADGYLIDFGNVKKAVKASCKRLNERFLCPMHSNVLDIVVEDQQVRIACQVDGSTFSFPEQDCALLPIVHATTEEIAIYLYADILNILQADYLIQRQIHTMEVTVAEAPGQEATFRLAIPKNAQGDEDFKLDVKSFITEGAVVPMPCLQLKPNDKKKNGCCPGCEYSKNAFSEKLERIAQAFNDGSLKSSSNGDELTAADLNDLLLGN